MSFGFKYERSLPLDADLVLMCVFLPNPTINLSCAIRQLEQNVFDYVMNHAESEEFYPEPAKQLSRFCQAIQRGKSVLTIAVGHRWATLQFTA